MIRSLQFKFLFLTIVISALSVLAVVLTSTRQAKIEMNEYASSLHRIETERLRSLARQKLDTKNWERANDTLREMSNLTGSHFLLLNPENQLIASFPVIFAKAEIHFQPGVSLTVRMKAQDEQMEMEMFPPSQIEIIDSQKKLVAYLIPLPGSPRQIPDQQDIVTSINRSTLVAAGLVMIVAIFAAFLFSRRILNPVRSLTNAANAMQRGDLSQRVNVLAKDEIGALSNAFNRMADNLARAEHLRQSMVNDIAHELRSPLTNLRAQIEAMQDDLLHPTKENLASLHEESMLLERMIDDLQDLALAEAGRLHLNREPVRIHETVRQCIQSFQAKAAVKSITVLNSVSGNLPAVYADEQRVAQILRNLIANSLAHTPSGGQLNFEATEIDGFVQVSLKDNGTGIEPHHLPNIFERFYRADGSRSRSTGGAGLGLAVVKQLVETQGGEARVESEYGKGSTFFIRLPKHQSS